MTEPGFDSAAPYSVRTNPRPLIGMICGIVGAVLAFIAYIVVIVCAAEDEGVGFVLLLLAAPALGLGAEALVLSISGMKRSIHTGGRKHVPGIVLSAVGITTAAVDLIFVSIAVFIGVMYLAFS